MQRRNRKKRQKPIDFYLDAELTLCFQKARELEHISDWYLRVMLFRFLTGTGIRINEARRLKVADCSDDFFTVTEGKGAKRSYPEPSPEFKPYYQAHLAKCRREGRTWFFYESRKHGPLRKLCNKPLGLRTLRKWWKEFIDEVGSIRYLAPHEGGRKTFGNWYKEILNRHDLQNQLGHESFRTTDQYYLGDIPGRRFSKPEPEWKKWARPPEEEHGLRVIQGGKV